MNMISVDSSIITAVGYRQGTLLIKFNSGRLYHYSNVPESTYKGLMSSCSHGEYFKSNIRGKYRDKKI